MEGQGHPQGWPQRDAACHRAKYRGLRDKITEFFLHRGFVWRNVSRVRYADAR